MPKKKEYRFFKMGGRKGTYPLQVAEKREGKEGT